MKETIIYCSIIFAFFFVAQIICCWKIKKEIIKAIPLYFILSLFLLALFLLLYEIYRTKQGGVAIYEIFAFIIACAAGVALVGDVAAWFVYWIKRYRMQDSKIELEVNEEIIYE